MLTGREIREARELLGLQPGRLAAKMRTVTTLTLKRAEADDHRPPIADFHMKAIRQTLERLGIEFTTDPPGVWLRKAEP